MKIYRETIVAGRTIIQSLRASTRIKTKKGEKRAPKSNPTPEAVRKVNLRNAVKHLTAILNHNFRVNDYHLTLTYSGIEPTKEEAKKNLQNFMKAVKRYCKKNGTEWKWVAVTEYENHRIHHHVVCSGIEPEVIKNKWSKGFVNFKMLEADGNYYRLAEYLIKETEKTFRLPDSVNKKRYSASGNVIRPEIKKELVSERLLQADPEPLKGYYIDQDTINRYEHVILGVECMEYIQVSLDEEPRLTKWRRGKKTKFEKHYKEIWPEQMTMEEWNE